MPIPQFLGIRFAGRSVPHFAQVFVVWGCELAGAVFRALRAGVAIPRDGSLNLALLLCYPSIFPGVRVEPRRIQIPTFSDAKKLFSDVNQQVSYSEYLAIFFGFNSCAR